MRTWVWCESTAELYSYTPFLPLSITLCAKCGRHQNTTAKGKHKKGKTFRFYVLMFYEYKFQYPVNYARVASLHWRRTANEIKLGFAQCFSRFRGAFHIWRYVGCWCVCVDASSTLRDDQQQHFWIIYSVWCREVGQDFDGTVVGARERPTDAIRDDCMLRNARDKKSANMLLFRIHNNK